MRLIALAVLLALPLRADAQTGEPCVVTKPGIPISAGDDFVGNLGNDALVVSLFPEGKIVFRAGGAGFILPDGALSMKVGWWRKQRGTLRIEGRRLDAPAPPLRARIPEGYGDTGFQSTALIFPTPGCWQVTGRVNERSLTFVTLVEAG